MDRFHFLDDANGEYFFFNVGFLYDICKFILFYEIFYTYFKFF